MRLVYFGSGAFGLPTLRQLSQGHEIALVVTQPDRPAGRHRALTPTPISEFARSEHIDTIKPANTNVTEVIQQIRAVDADAWIVVAIGQKLGADLLNNMFAINLHGSLLPKYRGAAPINWAMINGERETGISVIELAQRMDAGAILAQASTPIDPTETAGELHDRLALAGPELIEAVLRDFQGGELDPQPQDETLATHAPKLSKSDGVVHFDQPAIAARQRIHGLTPWPGCTVKLDGRPLRILRAEVVEQHAEYPCAGVVLADMTIACAPGSIRLLEVQAPGGRVMSFRDYCNGQPVRVGSRCEPP